jgi:hypothetical protein
VLEPDALSRLRLDYRIISFKNLAVLIMDAGQEMVTVRVTALDLSLANPWGGEKYSVELERSDTSVAKLKKAIERESGTLTWCQDLFKHGSEGGQAIRLADGDMGFP